MKHLQGALLLELVDLFLCLALHLLGMDLHVWGDHVQQRLHDLLTVQVSVVVGVVQSG
jgi:hypothetical protein